MLGNGESAAHQPWIQPYRARTAGKAPFSVHTPFQYFAKRPWALVVLVNFDTKSYTGNFIRTLTSYSHLANDIVAERDAPCKPERQWPDNSQGERQLRVLIT